MAALAFNTLTVPDFERPIRILNRDPSRPPSSNSLHRSMSEESLNKVTLPISRELPFFLNNMPPSPARTPPIGPSQVEQAYLADQILPVNVSITNLNKPVSTGESSPTASKDDVGEYIQQTADILSTTMKELQNLGLNENGGVEDLIAANLRLLKTLKDRHAVLDQVEQDVRKGRSQSSGPYTSINRSIYFDTPDFTPPHASRITFRDPGRRNSDDMDGVSTISIEWNEKKEERLVELEEKLKYANRNWSEEQNNYLDELEQLQDERRKYKKRVKMERRASIKMERTLSQERDRERRASASASTSRERASSTENKRRRSFGFVPKSSTRASSSSSFIERIFRVGK